MFSAGMAAVRPVLATAVRPCRAGGPVLGHRFMLTARFLQDVVDVVRESGDIIRRQWEKTTW